MARNIVVTMTCDLDHDKKKDPTVATRAIRYVYEGDEYEMDLCEEHAEEYDNWMSDYVNHSRHIVPDRPARRLRGTTNGNAPKRDLKEIRAWAQSNGYKVSEKGRVPGNVIQAFEAATG